MNLIGPKLSPLRLDPLSYEILRQQVLRRMAGGVNPAARWRTWKFITKNFAVTPAVIRRIT
jgi:hypothetical protein